MKSQKIALRLDHLQTLNDFHKLLGDINWIRPSLGLPTGQLQLLFNVLNGNSDPLSSRRLTDEGCQCITLIEKALQQAHIHYIDYSKLLQLLVFSSDCGPTRIFWQEGPIL